MIGQMKHILATEQKKTDFRPEDENNAMSALQYTTVSNTKFWSVAELRMDCKYWEGVRVIIRLSIWLSFALDLMFLCVLFLGVL